jgi:DNA-binding MarR family transcriptional regulator
MTDILDSTAFKLHRATVLVDRIADDYLVREHGIHYSAFVVLLMTRVLGETSQTAIAENLAVSRASITQRVSALTDRGLLAVTTDPKDSRANLVTLTAAGAALFDRAWRGLETHQSGLEHGVDEAALVAQLDRLIENSTFIINGGTR